MKLWAKIKDQKSKIIKSIIYIVAILSLVNVLFIGQHLRNDMGGIGKGIAGYFDLSFRSFMGAGYQINQGYGPITERILLLPKEHLKTAPFYYHRNHRQKRIPLYCTADTILSEGAKYGDCKITGGGGFYECMNSGGWYRPNCRGVVLHPSLWENKILRERIKQSLFKACDYLPDLSYIQKKGEGILRFDPLARPIHKNQVKIYVNQVSSYLHFASCANGKTKVTEFNVLLSNLEYLGHAAINPNHHRKIIRITADGGETIIKDWKQ